MRPASPRTSWAEGRLVRQVRHRNLETGAIVRGEPERPLKRRKV